MQQVAQALGWVAVAWGATVLWLTCGAWLLRRRLSKREPEPERDRIASLRVLLIRPCAGDERHLRRCLRSVQRARSSVVLEVVMAVDDAQDRALSVAREVAAELTAAGLTASAEVVTRRGPNRKVGILHAVLAPRVGRFDIVINADSNVDLDGYDLDRLVHPLTMGKSPGAVWSPHAEHTDVGSLGDRASMAVLDGSLHSFPLLCAIDPAGLVGKLFAVRTAAIVSLGGFESLIEFLGEDMELSRRLRKAGMSVRPVAAVARSLTGSRRLREAVARHARWMAVIRAQRPWLLVTFPLFFSPTPMLLACAGVAWLHAPWLAALGGVLALGGRLLVAKLARHFSGFEVGLATAAWDSVLADGVLLLAFARVVATRELKWRGMRLRLKSDGRIETR